MPTETKSRYRTEPIDVSEDIWLYETPGGVSVMKRERNRHGEFICTTDALIPWKVICDIADRYRKNRS